MADCKTNGHLWNSQRKCIMCKCDRPDEPAGDYLHDLRVMATDALDNPIDARVPRSERDLVVQAEILIELIDANSQNVELRARIAQLESQTPTDAEWRKVCGNTEFGCCLLKRKVVELEAENQRLRASMAQMAAELGRMRSASKDARGK